MLIFGVFWPENYVVHDIIGCLSTVGCVESAVRSGMAFPGLHAMRDMFFVCNKK